MADLRSQLETLFAAEIPLAGRLGVSVVRAGAHEVVLAAPLGFNRNHEGTVFGGSLNAVATLAGWSAVWLVLAEAGQDGVIVIQDSAIKYRRPVTADFSARATIDPTRRSAFLEALARKGKGRMTVDVEIADRAVEFGGRYVVSRESSVVRSQ